MKQTFRDFLNQAMAGAKITTKQLADQTGLSYSVVNHYVQGTRIPSATSLGLMADVLGVTMDELWRGTGIESEDSSLLSL